MNWSDLPTGITTAAIQRFAAELGESADTVAYHMVNNPSFMRALRQFLLNCGFEKSTSCNEAKEIMGKNFFGLKEAERHFMKKSRDCYGENLYFHRVPCSQDTLLASKESHILVAVFPMTVVDMYRMHRNHVINFRDDILDSRLCPFARDRFPSEMGWRLVRKGAAPNSIGLSIQEQKKLFHVSKELKDEEMPKSPTMVYAALGHFLSTGERIFGGVNLNCSDSCFGNAVSLGFKKDPEREGGPVVLNIYSGGLSIAGVGCASVRKRCNP